MFRARLGTFAATLIIMTTSHAAAPWTPTEEDKAREARMEELAKDPAVIEAQVQASAENMQWTEGLFCSALGPESPPGIRLAALNAAEQMTSHTTFNVQCPAIADESGRQAVARQAMRDGWESPAVLARVYQNFCVGSTAADWCDADAVIEQLARLEPDNAFVTLLPLQDSAFTADVPEIPHDIAEARILEAAAGTRFEDHKTAFAYDAYQVSHDYAQRHPAPELPPALQRVAREIGFTPPKDTAIAPATALAAFSNISTTGGWSVIRRVCDDAAAGPPGPLLDACHDVAELMAGSSSELTHQQGRAMQGAWQWKARSLTDEQAQAERILDFRLQTLVSRCQQPRNPQAMVMKPEAFDPESFVQLLRDAQAYGEREAYRLAAEREYKAHPDWYVIDPARCKNVYSLDADTRADLAELSELEGWDEAVKTFADQL